MLSRFLKTLTHSNQGEAIELLSYHIPKTAGSSLRLMLEQSYGQRKVFGVYERSQSRAMGTGVPISFRKGSKVLHGHFKPHKQHHQSYPQAVTMTWVRDPIERLWSLVGHLLRHKRNHPQYKSIEILYISKGITTREEIVRDILINKSIPHMVNTYSHFFVNVPIYEIDFVGSMHRFNDDVSKLNNYLNKNLEYQMVNVAPRSSIPYSIKRLDEYIAGEYEIVAAYL